jgi:hypothetical protein
VTKDHVTAVLVGPATVAVNDSVSLIRRVASGGERLTVVVDVDALWQPHMATAAAPVQNNSTPILRMLMRTAFPSMFSPPAFLAGFFAAKVHALGPGPRMSGLR